jgi:hypothetical protein
MRMGEGGMVRAWARPSRTGGGCHACARTHVRRVAAPARFSACPPPPPINMHATRCRAVCRHDVFSAGPKKELEAAIRDSKEFKYLFEDRDKWVAPPRGGGGGGGWGKGGGGGGGGGWF